MCLHGWRPLVSFLTLLQKLCVMPDELTYNLAYCSIAHRHERAVRDFLEIH